LFPIDDGEIECNWIDEVSDRADTNTSKLGEGEIPAMEIYAKPKVSQRLIEDSTVNIDMWLTDKANRAFARKSNTAFVTGNGNKMPRGFLDYDTTTLAYEKNKLETVTTATGAISVDDLLNLYAKLFDEYMTADARFVMSKEIFIDLCKLKESTSGAYLINPRLLFEGFKPQILGVPIQYLQDMPKTQSANAKAIALGNFKEGYTIVDRLGMSIVNDNITSVGFLKMNFRMRVGGGLTNSQAIKLLKIHA
jgi:HK97 family phage major capsid protein